MNSELLITNVGHIVSIIVTISLIVIVFIRGKGAHITKIFFLFGLATIIWELSYVIGINIANPNLSRLVFMGNAATLIMVVFNAHLVLLLTGYIEKQKKILYALYGIASALIIFFAIKPDLFLKPSEPLLYFTNFFVQGDYYFVGDILFFGVLIYLLVNLAYAYRKGDRILKNRLRYFTLAIAIGYGVGSVPLLLLYGIAIDPFISFLFGLYSIPMAYSIVEYDLIDINVVAKRAFRYALGIAGVTLVIMLINSADNALTTAFPSFPHWVIPGVSGILAVLTIAYVWKKIREVDILKDEFINIVMHKFRTPLTYIKWSVETIKAAPVTDEQKKELDNIAEENIALVGLTNTLVNLANIGTKENLYNVSEEHLPDMVEKALTDRKTRIELKHILIQTHYADNLPTISVDPRRIEFALETIIDNAITYTPDGGTVSISITKNEHEVTLSVKDSGIGISKEDLSRLFSKFFRGAGAKTDTEGMGIGLFITKDIINRHKGKIGAESEGLGKGSTFSITLPFKR